MLEILKRFPKFFKAESVKWQKLKSVLRHIVFAVFAAEQSGYFCIFYKKCCQNVLHSIVKDIFK